MSNGFMNKIKNWVSGDPFEEELYGFEEEFDTENRYMSHSAQDMEEKHYEAPRKKSNLKLVDHPNSNLTQVVVIEPTAFEEALEIVDHLRHKKSVILNLHLLDVSQSQRVVDFLSGATHAIDGNQQRIGDGVFMFTASNVSITAEAEKGISMSDAFWNHTH